MKIGVLMGGISSEREVSLLSGKMITEALKIAGYIVEPLIINSKNEVISKVIGFDFIFIALHGVFGEDGSVQALLEVVGIPYSGCGVLCSALCMDKIQSKRILQAEGILVPKANYFLKEEIALVELEKNMSYPIIVKPNKGGSSIGVTLAQDKKELEQAIKFAQQYGESILIEEYIQGIECTICLLAGEVLPILRITPKHTFFDYASKYEEKGAEEVEAPLSADLKEKIFELGQKCWKIFECKSYVRIDIIIRNQEIFVIELNTLPGMTKESLFPKSATLRGISYVELLQQMIRSSLEKEGKS